MRSDEVRRRRCHIQKGVPTRWRRRPQAEPCGPQDHLRNIIMKLFISVASAAIVGGCLFSTAASASSGREPVSVRVSRAGLDLTSDAGRTAFQRRLRSAIASACQPRSGGLDALADAQRCRKEMTADAGVKMAVLFGRSGTQIASIGTAR
jgi:UrcA family protein